MFKKNISVRVDGIKAQKFKIICADKNISQQKMMEKFINHVIKKHEEGNGDATRAAFDITTSRR